MNVDSALTARSRPRPFDLVLVVIGPTRLGAGPGMFQGLPRPAVLGLAPIPNICLALGSLPKSVRNRSYYAISQPNSVSYTQHNYNRKPTSIIQKV